MKPGIFRSYEELLGTFITCGAFCGLLFSIGYVVHLGLQFASVLISGAFK